MKTQPVIAIRDVDTSVPGDGMRIYDRGWVDGMFPLFLHFGVHDEERVVGEVDGDLTGGVGWWCGCLGV